MPRLAFALTLALVGLGGRAYAQDAGTSSTADGGVPAGCGAITVEGECQGNVVVYCDEANDELVMLDCPTEYDPNAICQPISVDFGVYCAIPVGQDCYDVDTDGNLDPYLCQGTNPGCLDVNDVAACTENVGPCADDQIGNCTGDRLLFYCTETQPYLIDCAALGGTCQTQGCRGLPTDSACDDETFFCAAGNECVAVPGSPDAFNCRPIGAGNDAGVTADAGPNADAGSVDVSTNLPNPDDDKGCGCTAHRAQAAPVGIFFALVYLFRRRDRR